MSTNGRNLCIILFAIHARYRVDCPYHPWVLEEMPAAFQLYKPTMSESETDLGPMGQAQAQEIDGLPASIVGGLLGDALEAPGGPGSNGPLGVQGSMGSF